VAAARAFALRYAHTTADEIHWGLIRMVLASVADTAIIPMQDILGLDSRARMNFPGKAEGNWGWRYRSEQLIPAVRDRLADLTATYSRWNGAVPARWDPRYRPPPKDEG
jgi:4-alpha-glucanotransferase